MYHVTCRC